MTVADFLAWEAQQTERHEFIDGEVFAMTGARVLHQLLALNLIYALQHPLRKTGCFVLQDGTKLKVPGVVPKLSETPGDIGWAGPALGEHTDEVLLELGYGREEISALRNRKVI